MKTPSVFARVLCVILAFLLMLVLAADCALLQVKRVTGDRTLYLSAGAPLQTLREEKLNTAIAEAAEANHFSPDSLKGIIDGNVIRQQEEAVVDWLIGLFHGTTTEAAPVWDSTEVEEVIRADEQFRAAVPSAMRKIVARDEAGSAITTALSNVVSPIRMDVLRMGISMVRSKIDITVIVNHLDQIILLGFGCAFVLCLLIILLMHRQILYATYFIGSGLIAGALMTGMVILFAAKLDIPAVCSIMSGLAAQLFAQILSQLGTSAGLVAAIYLVLGMVLMIIFRTTGKKAA